MIEIPTSSSRKDVLTVAREAALMAGEILMDRYRTTLKVAYKGRGNIVTDVDLMVEKAVFDFLGKEYPDMEMLGEESSGNENNRGFTWIVDPLDGTRNYASGIPVFSTVIGLVFDGEVLAGVNYDPIAKDMFEAQKGKGFYMNGNSASVSNREMIEECIIGMDMSYDNQGASNGLDIISKIWPGMQTARIMGSAALGISYAAAGLIDLYFHHKLAPWDQVSGILMLEEAGGIITDRQGAAAGLYSDGIVASNKILHKEFMDLTEGTSGRRPTGRQLNCE